MSRVSDRFAIAESLDDFRYVINHKSLFSRNRISLVVHRINLRGPWTLKLQGGLLVAHRNFHRPASGLRFHLFIQYALDYPIESCWVNQVNVPVLSESNVDSVGQADVTDILMGFNEIRIAWNQWPTEFANDDNNQADAPLEIRYTPSPSHPLHFDSWLEIHE